MSVCTYDNPDTMQRECWSDGKLVCAYHFRLLMDMEKRECPRFSKVFFWGANIGPWEMGQIVGDSEAIGDE